MLRNIVIRRLAAIALLIFAGLQKCAVGEDASQSTAPTQTHKTRTPTNAKSADIQQVDDMLEPIRLKYKLPALATAAVKNDRLISIGAVGVRRAGGKESVSAGDQFHIGSCTKAMTATLCALLIQQGKLKWDSTIGEVFSDQREKIHPKYRRVTLQQLLMHRSGLPEDRAPDPVLWPQIRALKGPMLAQRRHLVELVLANEPKEAADAKFQYSNAGYTVAGAMCERVTGKSWEALMREQLFKPLKMTTAGFGPPGSAAGVKQPWGHLENGEKWMPVPPGPLADNPAVIGPAGTVHCSLADWAKFAAMHLRGEKGKETLLPAEVFRKLHTATDGDYAFGWIVGKRGWAGGPTLQHVGSNTMWTADIWLAPNNNTAYLAATNVGTQSGFEACDAAITELIKSSSKPHP